MVKFHFARKFFRTNYKIFSGSVIFSQISFKVYDPLLNNVPTISVPEVLGSFAKRIGINLTDIPHRTTVEAMARELGIIADLQTAEKVLANQNCTLGLEATTQEGHHVNSIHVTTETSCLAMAVDELPGGTGEDYHTHTCESIENLAKLQCHFNPNSETTILAKS